MSKLSIDGRLIGTIADKVNYGKNNSATVEDALDTLFEGAGSDTPTPSEESVLSLLESKFIVNEGINSAPWSNKQYSALTVSQYSNPLNGWENTDKYVNPEQTSLFGDSLRSVCFRIYKGDVIHYNELGGVYYRPIVVTDMNYKVLYAGDIPASGTYSSGTYNVTEDGFVFAEATIANGSQNPYIYTQWSNRKALKTKPVYAAYGDSISADSGFSAGRPVCYPWIVANLMDADVEIHARAGNWSESFIEPSWQGPKFCRMDADVISINIGYNDVSKIAEGRYTLGDADEVLALDFHDDYDTLSSSYIGRYRIAIEMFLARAPKANILCVSHIGVGNETSLHTDLRSELSDLVTKMNNPRVTYVDGTSILSYSSGSIFFLSGDAVHPIEIGQFVMAYKLYYNHIKQLIEP